MKQYLSIFILVAVLVALGGLGYMRFHKTQPVKLTQSSALGRSTITVSGASSPKLDSKTTASSTPPANSSSTSTPVASNLQSNVNVNDPSLAGNSLVQSVNTGVSP